MKRFTVSKASVPQQLYLEFAEVASLSGYSLGAFCLFDKTGAFALMLAVLASSFKPQFYQMFWFGFFLNEKNS